jgi:hypothetical protein
MMYSSSLLCGAVIFIFFEEAFRISAFICSHSICRVLPSNKTEDLIFLSVLRVGFFQSNTPDDIGSCSVEIQHKNEIVILKIILLMRQNHIFFFAASITTP